MHASFVVIVDLGQGLNESIGLGECSIDRTLSLVWGWHLLVTAFKAVRGSPILCLTDQGEECTEEWVPADAASGQVEDGSDTREEDAAKECSLVSLIVTGRGANLLQSCLCSLCCFNLLRC